MMKNTKGSAALAITLLVLAIIAIVGATFYYVHTDNSSSVATQTGTNNPPSANPTSTTPATSTTPIANPSSTSSNATLSPSSGPVGTSVTIHGSGFSSAGNTVTFGGLTNAALKNLSSSDGKTLTFTVPGSVGPNCKTTEPCPQFVMLLTPRAYTIEVISNTATQTIGTFTVTGNSVQ